MILCYTVYFFIVLYVQNVKYFISFVAGTECLGRVVYPPACSGGSVFDSRPEAAYVNRFIAYADASRQMLRV